MRLGCGQSRLFWGPPEPRRRAAASERSQGVPDSLCSVRRRQYRSVGAGPTPEDQPLEPQEVEWPAAAASLGSADGLDRSNPEAQPNPGGELSPLYWLDRGDRKQSPEGRNNRASAGRKPVSALGESPIL